jgi:tyrosyl-tRNA synthetase
MNGSDADVSTYIKIFSLKSRGEIEALEAEHSQAPHLRVLQKALAEEITTRVHSAEDYKAAVEASGILFGNSTAEAFASLSEETFLDIFDGVPQFTIAKSELEAGLGLVEMMAEKTQIFPSKGEARKMIAAGGVSINKEKLMDVEAQVNASQLINNKYLIAQKGKKNYFLIIAE